MNINEEAMERLLTKLPAFVWTTEKGSQMQSLREEFRTTYSNEKIQNLEIDDYFLGHGRRHGSMAWELEWGTRELGSIKGGSNVKFGLEEDFPKIKELLKLLVSLDDCSDSSKALWLAKLVDLSRDIRGFRTGRTVLPKLLSIYYLDSFIPLFNDQDFYISKLTVGEIDTENSGLQLYLNNNEKLLFLKKELGVRIDRILSNDEFANLLYFVFPKDETSSTPEVHETVELVEETKFDVLEVPHYQSLLDRNFATLFPGLRYFKDDVQKPKNGQYDTQDVGIMDFLAMDSNGDFVVIEIKRQATDRTIGQILRYMGWVKTELCKEGQTVKGIIVAEQLDKRLRFALDVIENVTFLKLTLSVALN
jgi:hypothetical protein